MEKESALEFTARMITLGLRASVDGDVFVPSAGEGEYRISHARAVRLLSYLKARAMRREPAPSAASLRDSHSGPGPLNIWTTGYTRWVVARLGGPFYIAPERHEYDEDARYVYSPGPHATLEAAFQECIISADLYEASK
jgi:hypothetical protein